MRNYKRLDFIGMILYIVDHSFSSLLPAVAAVFVTPAEFEGTVAAAAREV